MGPSPESGRPSRVRLSVSQIYRRSQALSHGLSRDWLGASPLMAVERLAGSLSFLPLSSWRLYIGSYPQTSFLCEALPGPRHRLSPCLLLTSGFPPITLSLGLCFCACLPPGRGAPRRQGRPPLLSEPQCPVSLSSPCLFPQLSSPSSDFVSRTVGAGKRPGGLAVTLAHC